MKIIFKRRNSNEIGINLKNLGYSHRNIRMRQTNIQTHRVNILNFSKYNLGEHYQLANSEYSKKLKQNQRNKDSTSSLLKRTPNFRYNKKFTTSKPQSNEAAILNGQNKAIPLNYSEYAIHHKIII